MNVFKTFVNYVYLPYTSFYLLVKFTWKSFWLIFRLLRTQRHRTDSIVLVCVLCLVAKYYISRVALLDNKDALSKAIPHYSEKCNELRIEIQNISISISYKSHTWCAISHKNAMNLAGLFENMEMQTEKKLHSTSIWNTR